MVSTRALRRERSHSEALLTRSEVMYAVAVAAALAAAAACIFVGMGESDESSARDVICDPLLQTFGLVAWVISFAFSALWLLTHCKCPTLCAPRRWAAACSASPRACRLTWSVCIADRLQTFLQDPSKWISFGLIGEMKEARNSRETGSGAKKSPMISVLLPVKGVHERTLMHWRSQVKASHGGPMEFIFCMESAEDPAHAAALEFKKECGSSATIKVVNCGLSFYSSQKIHNLLQGVACINKSAEYVLFLDDDAQMSSTILSDLLFALETESDCLIASGWPNDYLPPNSSFEIGRAHV